MMESKTESSNQSSDEDMNSETEKLLPNLETQPKRKLFGFRVIFQILLISSIVIIILSVFDAWYHLKALPTVNLKRGSLYLDNSDSSLQFSVTGKSRTLKVQNNKLSSQSYLNSYELQETNCIVSYSKNASTYEWLDFAYIHLSLQDDDDNHDGIQFNLVLNDIEFHNLRDVAYLTYWYEAHAVKLQCKTGIINKYYIILI